MHPSKTSNLSVTRRHILGMGGVGIIGSLACSMGLRAESSPGVVIPKREDFLPHLNTDFRVGSSGTSCSLIEIGEAQKVISPTAEFLSFSLIFAASKETMLESQIHPLSHRQLGAMELFLSPVGQSKDFVHLEAICCHRA